jgi:hypothetical protein
MSVSGFCRDLFGFCEESFYGGLRVQYRYNDLKKERIVVSASIFSRNGQTLPFPGPNVSAASRANLSPGRLSRYW